MTVQVDGMLATVCVVDEDHHGLVEGQHEKIGAISDRIIQMGYRIEVEAALVFIRGGRILQIVEEDAGLAGRGGPCRTYIGFVVDISAVDSGLVRMELNQPIDSICRLRGSYSSNSLGLEKVVIQRSGHVYQHRHLGVVVIGNYFRSRRKRNTSFPEEIQCLIRCAAY